jgi:hypothetical protein
MGYNITAWKIREITDLKLKISDLYTNGREDFRPKLPELIDFETGMVKINNCGCGGYITGILDNGFLTIEKISGITDDGSGTFFHDILEPAFKNSTGTLKARLIWEGGDTIETIELVDGVLTIISEE